MVKFCPLQNRSWIVAKFCWNHAQASARPTADWPMPAMRKATLPGRTSSLSRKRRAARTRSSAAASASPPPLAPSTSPSTARIRFFSSCSSLWR